MTQDYTVQIKSLLSSKFVPGKQTSDNKKLTLNQIYHLVISVIPEKWVSETDVFQAMQELGYSPEILPNDEGGYMSVYLMTEV